MSWSMLFGEAFVVAVVLILPGMLASRAFGVPFKQSLSFGPVITVFFFLVFMGIALRFIGVAEGLFCFIDFVVLFCCGQWHGVFFRFHGRRAFFDTDILTLLPYLCAPLACPFL